MIAARRAARIARGLLLTLALSLSLQLHAQKTAKPVLHGKHWVAIAGKPLAVTVDVE